MKIKKLLTPLLLILLLASIVAFGAPQPMGPYFDDTYLEYGNNGLNVKTATVTDGDTTHVPTSDNVYDFCETTQNYAQATDKLSYFASTTSAELAGVISDEEGTGKLVYNDSPTFTTQITTPKVVGDSSVFIDGLYINFRNTIDSNNVNLRYDTNADDKGIYNTLYEHGAKRWVWGKMWNNDDLIFERWTGASGSEVNQGVEYRITSANGYVCLAQGSYTVGIGTSSPSGNLDINVVTDADPSLLFSENDATKWKIYNDHTTDALEVYSGATRRYSFGSDGTAIADVAWNTFSPKITATGRDLLYMALEDANKPVKPYEGIPVKKTDDELFDIVPTEYQEEVDKLDEEGNPVLDEDGKPVKEIVTKIKDVKVFRERRPNEFATEEEVQAEFDKYAKCPAKIAIASAKYLEYLTGIIDNMQAKIDELETRVEKLEQKEAMK